MPRRRADPPKPQRRSPGTGTVTYVAARRRYRARLPIQDGQRARESWHLLRDEAEAWIARELKRESDAFDPMQSLGAYLNYWRDLKEPSWGAQTAIRYRSEAAALGPLRQSPLLGLRGDRVQAHQAAMIRRGVTRRYTYNVMALLRRALADAVKWRIIDANVMDTVTLPEPEHRQARAWSLAEVRSVLAAIVGHRFEGVYLLILWGGLRIGEAVALRWEQIADDGTVAFTEAEHTHVRGRPIGTTKRERVRETQIPAHVVARLSELKATGPHAMDWPGRPKRGVAYVYVAQRPDGSRWTARTIRDDWVRLVTATKVTPLRPHGGRRAFGTMHMVAGTALADLSALLGHSSPAVTAQAYIASDLGRRREAAERLAELIEPSGSTPSSQPGGQTVF